jgi:methylmalonyl-CoA mutase C-terminal domain/subunit
MRIRHFCSHGENARGQCLSPSGKPVTAARRAGSGGARLRAAARGEPRDIVWRVRRAGAGNVAISPAAIVRTGRRSAPPNMIRRPAGAPMTDPAPSSSTKKIRVVVAKPGLDGHDRGAKIIARALRDAGMEVIYTGLHQTPEQIVETVIQEDADAVGLSILSGAHMTLVPRIVTLLQEQGIDDVVVTVGGTIPSDDIPELKRLGVAEVFTPGASTEAIVDFIRGAVASA